MNEHNKFWFSYYYASTCVCVCLVYKYLGFELVSREVT